MASEKEIHALMSYLGADSGTAIDAMKRRVWLDQFHGEPINELMQAARLVLARKEHSGFPRVQELWKALNEVRNASVRTWAQSWDTWVSLAQKFGSYRLTELLTAYESQDPLGFRAIGTMAREWFFTNTVDMPTFRAQFRMRYESLERKDNFEAARPKDMRDGLAHSPILKLVHDTTKALPELTQTNGIAPKQEKQA